MKKLLYSLILISFTFSVKAEEVKINENLLEISVDSQSTSTFLIFNENGKKVAGGSFKTKTEFDFKLLPKDTYYVYVWINDKFYSKKIIL